ncbi:MAG: hypothetical protein KYX62_03900 [Pseudomonadota bacterium]|nr:hypothetical protein [Pseudomonadota bacterium]
MYDFQSLQEFKSWESKIPEKINHLKTRLEDSIDFNKPKLEVVKDLSDWILNNYETVEMMKSSPDIWDEISCYIGELYRTGINGKWDIKLNPEDSSDVYYKIPVVCNTPPAICPSFTITTLIHRKRPLFIVDSIKKQIKRFDNLQIME